MKRFSFLVFAATMIISAAFLSCAKEIYTSNLGVNKPKNELVETAPRDTFSLVVKYAGTTDFFIKLNVTAINDDNKGVGKIDE